MKLQDESDALSEKLLHLCENIEILNRRIDEARREEERLRNAEKAPAPRPAKDR
jgi:hypothetical protein